MKSNFQAQTRMHRFTLAAVDWAEAAAGNLAAKWPALLLIAALLVIGMCSHAHAQDVSDGTVDLALQAGRHAVWHNCEPPKVSIAEGQGSIVVYCPDPPTIGVPNDGVTADAIFASGFDPLGMGSRNWYIRVMRSTEPPPGQPHAWIAQTCTLGALDVNTDDPDYVLAACTYLVRM